VGPGPSPGWRLGLTLRQCEDHRSRASAQDPSFKTGKNVKRTIRDDHVLAIDEPASEDRTSVLCRGRSTKFQDHKYRVLTGTGPAKKLHSIKEISCRHKVIYSCLLALAFWYALRICGIDGRLKTSALVMRPRRLSSTPSAANDKAQKRVSEPRPSARGSERSIVGVEKNTSILHISSCRAGPSSFFGNSNLG